MVKMTLSCRCVRHRSNKKETSRLLVTWWLVCFTPVSQSVPHNNRSYKPASPMFVFLGWNVHPDKRRLDWQYHQYQKHHVYLAPTNLKKINGWRTSHWNCLPISSWQTLRSTWETRWEELQAVGGSKGSLRCLLLAELYSIIAINLYLKTSLNQEIDGNRFFMSCTYDVQGVDWAKESRAKGLSRLLPKASKEAAEEKTEANHCDQVQTCCVTLCIISHVD